MSLVQKIQPSDSTGEQLLNLPAAVTPGEECVELTLVQAFPHLSHTVQRAITGTICEVRRHMGLITNGEKQGIMPPLLEFNDDSFLVPRHQVAKLLYRAQHQLRAAGRNVKLELEGGRVLITMDDKAQQ